MLQIIVIAALCILGLLSLSSYFAWFYPIELLTHFRVQYLVIALILTAILFILHQKRIIKNKAPIFIALVIISLNIVEILPWYLPTSQQAINQTPQIRIESFNVNVENKEYQKSVDIVRKDKPDIALFIEIHDTWYNNLKTRLKDTFPYSFRSPGGGLAVFSRIPLEDAQGVNLDEAGHHLVTNLKVNGKTIHFIGTHPMVPVKPWTFHRRNRQLAALEKYINQQQNPVIIAGDFNLSPWSPYYRKFIKKTGLHNTRLGFGTLPSWPRAATHVKIPSWLIPLVNIPIDHCFVSKDFGVVNTGISQHGNSDHAAIVVDLVLHS
ncbi:endonuclease/exonuclease/phosphatase [Calothrix sp. NIES-4071]|nr:endonuclease/exonuclease/phosphatase [Calothrix sp. NIES-4071]BAZ58419.1 endonuclease/exonuclease/phosphatase [Calothrix sp. NIES-4105]